MAIPDTAKPLRKRLDAWGFFRDLGGDEPERSLADHVARPQGGCGFACVALVAGHKFRGGCPASMVIRT